MSDDEHAREGVLRARPSDTPPSRAYEPGTFPLERGRGRNGLLHVPTSVRPDEPAPLLIMLHGAGASASDVMPMVAACADRHAVIVVAPDSQGATWDMIQRRYGPDVATLDRALTDLFATHAIDPARIAIAGFSDGASYAISLGITNGDLFSAILAFSPGFAAPTRAVDAPRVFISHGRQDSVLPLERCGRRVAAALRESGYDVDYREFSGGHVVPTEMVAAAFARFLGNAD